MQFNGLALLDLVPHDDLLWREVELPFARQMIPAGDGKDIPDAELHRGPGEIELRRLEDDERSQDHHIWAMFAEVRVIDCRAACRLLQQVKDTDQQVAPRPAEAFRDAYCWPRCPLTRPRQQCRCVAVRGAKEAKVKPRPAESRRELPPMGF